MDFEVAVLDWLLVDGTPLFVVESVVKVNSSGPNMIVSKKPIVVPCFNIDDRGSWKVDIKVIRFENFRLSSV